MRYFILFLLRLSCISFFFFFNDTATTEIYTLSLHDALPISMNVGGPFGSRVSALQLGWFLLVLVSFFAPAAERAQSGTSRSEEHTSELQSRPHLVCRLLLEKKKKQTASTRTRDACRPRRHCA